MKTIRENYNYRQVIELIINNDGISRAQISRDINLNRSTISYIINYFLENSLVYETSEKVQTGGRASTLIKFNYKLYKIMIIDLQKNKVKILITDLSGEEIDRLDYSINHSESSALSQMEESITDMLNKHPQLQAIGIAIHGVVSISHKLIHSPFYDYSYHNIEQLVIHHKLPVYIENEANIYANGIYNKLGNQIESLINIHIKDGVGSGHISNGTLVRGDSGFAGEIGHSISVPNGLQCKCGNRGCLELYCSEQAIRNQIEAVTKQPFTYEQIDYLLSTNQEIKQVYINAIELLAIKLNDLILFTDTQTIYISSDLFNQVSSFKDDLKQLLSTNTYIQPIIKVNSTELSTFTTGFADIIMNFEFGLNK